MARSSILGGRMGTRRRPYPYGANQRTAPVADIFAYRHRPLGVHGYVHPAEAVRQRRWHSRERPAVVGAGVAGGVGG